MPDFNLVRIDAAENAGAGVSKKRVLLGTPIQYIRPLQLPINITLYPGSSGIGIPVTDKSEIDLGECVDQLFYDHEGGTGEVVLLVSNTLRVGPSSGGGASGAAETRRSLAHVTPRGVTGVTLRDIVSGATDANVQSASTAGVGAQSVNVYDPATRLYQFRINAPTGDSTRAFLTPAAGSALPQLPHLLSIINDPQGGWGPANYGRDFLIRASTRARFSIGGAGANPAHWCGWGLGEGNYSTVSGNWTQAFIGFRQTFGDVNLRAVVAGANNVVHVSEELVGYPMEEINDIAVEVGVEDGAPLIRWLVNGDVAHTVNLPLPAEFTVATYLNCMGGFAVAHDTADRALADIMMGEGQLLELIQ